MRRTGICIVLILAFCVVPLSGPAAGEALTADAIITKMKEAIEPGIASTRTLEFSIMDSQGNTTNTWVSREGRMELPDGKRTLLVMLTPLEVKGIARLVWENKDGDSYQWMYLPVLKRTRVMGPLNSYDSFQGTDFTYSDIGFLEIRGTHTLIGEADHTGVQAYTVETTPAKNPYFSKIITVIAKDTFLPIERTMYDLNGVLWKTHSFENVTVINKIPTPLLVRMVDNQTKTSTLYKVDQVCYGAVIPAEIFEPKNLPGALQFDFCPLPAPPK